MKKTENGEFVLSEQEVNKIAQEGYFKGAMEMLKAIQNLVNTSIETIEKKKSVE